ncbi:MAG: acyltransferase [Candidatus Xenobia bacterium]
MSPALPSVPARNNFDLIRLLAAFQVVQSHATEHLGLLSMPFFAFTRQLLSYFPGVPIFFFISGYLLTESYQRNPSLRVYFVNRALRVFPALYAAFGVTLALVFWMGAAGQPQFSLEGLALWSLAQLTFLQFYNPPFLRAFGVGTVNGSLWTIPVELQFYLLLPLLVRRPRWLLMALYLVSLGLQLHVMLHPVGVSELLRCTFLPHIHMFLAGLAARHLAPLWLPRVGRPLSWLAAYLVLTQLTRLAVGENHLLMLISTRLLLPAVILAVAYWPRLDAEKLLGRNDISYGVYIYHMLVVNTLIVLGLTGRWYWLALVFVVTTALGWLSWRLVERPFLRLKRWSNRQSPVGRVRLEN